jgi:phosphoglycerate dehydrogenase-like enzyme
MSQRVVMVDKTVPFEGAHWERLVAAIGDDRMIVVDPKDTSAVADALQSAEIAILAGDLDERFTSAPNLKWIHCDHAGLTKSARPAVFERGLIVTGSAGRSGPALAEHVMMFALMLCSRYPDLYEAQKRQEWFRTPSMFDLRALYGRTIGILGMGHTGVELAKRAKAFNMTVLGYRRRDLPRPDGVDQMFCSDKGDGIDTILERADILALVLNLSDATHHLIDEAAIARMKRGSVIINLARGGVIDQDALIAALNSGHLGGAGLDVTDPEPLPQGHPLWTTTNVLITPHFTAAVPDKVDRSLEVISDNFKRYRAGEPMLNRMTAEDLWTKGA